MPTLHRRPQIFLPYRPGPARQLERVGRGVVLVVVAVVLLILLTTRP